MQRKTSKHDWEKSGQNLQIYRALLWRSSVYFQKTRLRFYQSNVLSVLLYGSECWRMTQKDTNRLSSFHNTCLKKILKVHWPETISNTRLHQATEQHICFILKEKVGMAWSCLQDEQRPASKNSANLDARWKQKKRQAENNVAMNNGRRTEGNMGHNNMESPRQRGLGRSCASLMCHTA